MVLSRYVGAEVRRKEDPRLITGSSTYVDDVPIAGMGYIDGVTGPEWWQHRPFRINCFVTARLAAAGFTRFVASQSAQ